MTDKTIITTDQAPAAIGTYSQAVKAGNTVYFSGQIPLNPSTMEMVTESFDAQAVQVGPSRTDLAPDRAHVATHGRPDHRWPGGGHVSEEFRRDRAAHAGVHHVLWLLHRGARRGVGLLCQHL